MTSRVAAFKSTNSLVVSPFENKERNRVMTSDARLASRSVRWMVRAASLMSGGSADSIRKQAAAFVAMPDSG